MATPEDRPKKAHWSIPHVIGVLIAIVVYYVIFRFTGDSDLFIALATGAASAFTSWAILFTPWLRGK